jgi:hypothetical protein
MGNNKAAGTDGIPVEVYKDMPEEALKLLAKIYNICVKNNYTPGIW